MVVSSLWSDEVVDLAQVILGGQVVTLSPHFLLPSTAFGGHFKSLRI